MNECMYVCMYVHTAVCCSPSQPLKTHFNGNYI